MKRHRIALWLAVAAAGLVQAELIPTEKTNGLIPPGTATVLEFRVAGTVADDGLAYVLYNYAGGKVGQGKGTLADGKVTVTLTLAAGYYDLTFPALKQTFGVLSIAMPERKDPFFCIDAGLSWLAREEPGRSRLIATMRQLNIDIARERLWWGSVNSGVDQYDWEGDRQYESVRKQLRQQGIGVLELFHDTPSYMKPSANNPYPADLLAASRAFGTIAERWKDLHAGFEIWNEPDIHFGGHLPADQYVSLAKAASAGVSAAKVRTPLVGGVLATLETDAYLRGLSAGGLMQAVDAFSFHNYRDDGESVRHEIVKCRQWLEQAGAPGAPIWITEIGKSWPTGPDRADEADDQACAWSIVAKAVESRACGVARYFPFVLPFYSEGDRNFSMTGKDGTPLRYLAAYGACVATLSHHAYAGDFTVETSKTNPVRRAPVFVNPADGQAVLVLDAGNKSAPDSVFPWSDKFPKIVKILGIDGRELKLEDGAVPLDDKVVYVLVAAKDVEKHLKTDTEAMRLTKLAQKGHQRPAPPSIVLQYMPDFKQVQGTSRGWRIRDREADLTQWPMTVRVNNLSEKEMTLRVGAWTSNKLIALPAAYPEGATYESIHGMTHSALAVQKTTVPAAKSTDVTLALNIKTDNGEILLVALDDDGNLLDRLLIQFAQPK